MCVCVCVYVSVCVRMIHTATASRRRIVVSGFGGITETVRVHAGAGHLEERTSIGVVVEDGCSCTRLFGNGSRLCQSSTETRDVHDVDLDQIDGRSGLGVIIIAFW